MDRFARSIRLATAGSGSVAGNGARVAAHAESAAHRSRLAVRQQDVAEDLLAFVAIQPDGGQATGEGLDEPEAGFVDGGPDERE